MGLLAVTTPAVTGTLAAPAAMSVADTINGNLAPTARLKVINGAGAPVTFTIVDPGHTGMGNTGTNAGVAVANATARWFALTTAMIDPDGFIHTTLSSATSVTYELIP